MWLSNILIELNFSYSHKDLSQVYESDGNHMRTYILKKIYSKTIFLTLICIFIDITPISLQAEQKNCFNSDVTKKWSQIIDKQVQNIGVNKSDLGIVFYYNGSELFSTNSNKMMIPASITKIATTAAVFDQLENLNKLETKFATNGTIENDILKGDLYLIGGGDPSFVSESLWYLINVLTRTGIKKIEGNLIIDDSYFDDIRFDESRESVRVDRAYDSPVGAMSLNWNTINIFLRPGDNIGAKAKAITDPESDYVELVNNLKTGSKTDYSVERKYNTKTKKDTIIVSGKIDLKSPEIAVYKGVSDPISWVGANVISFLKQRNISLSGSIQTGKAPTSIKILAKSESKPLEYIVADMDKFSNNYVAEMLTKNLSAYKYGQGTLAKGIELIKETLNKAGVTSQEFELYNPSGFTRENKFTPNSMIKILEMMRKDFRIFSHFLNALPISGVDGTLKNRMKNGNARRWIRAKTGLLTGVNTLAGYMGLENGEVITFVLIHNGPQDGAKVRSSFDNLLNNLTEKLN